MMKSLSKYLVPYFLLVQLFIAIMWLVHDMLYYTLPFTTKISLGLILFTLIYLMTTNRKVLIYSFISLLVIGAIYAILQWLFVLLIPIETLIKPLFMLWQIITHGIPLPYEYQALSYSLIAIYFSLLLRALSRGKWQTFTLGLITLSLIEISELLLVAIPFWLLIYLVFWLLLFVLYHVNLNTPIAHSPTHMGNFILTAASYLGLLLLCGWVFITFFSAPPRTITGPSNSHVSSGDTTATLTSSLSDSVSFSNDILFFVESDRTLYLRNSVSDTFINNTWETLYSPKTQIQEVADGLPTKEATITIKNMETTRYFTPYDVYNLTTTKGVPLYNTQRLFTSDQPLVDGDRYTFSYLDVTQHSQDYFNLLSKEPLSPSEKSLDLQLPADLPVEIVTLAKTLTEGESQPYDKALAIESYFKDNFTYSLNPTIPEGKDKLTYFLFEGREGYCTYFASSMTLMLRSIRIPARLAQGYLSIGPMGPVLDGDEPVGFDVANFMNSKPNETTTNAITDKNAHAWVEVYIENIGWVTFDPTVNSNYITYLDQEEITEIQEKIVLENKPVVVKTWPREIRGYLTLFGIILFTCLMLISQFPPHITNPFIAVSLEKKIANEFVKTLKYLKYHGYPLEYSDSITDLFSRSQEHLDPDLMGQLKKVYETAFYGPEAQLSNNLINEAAQSNKQLKLIKRKK